MNDILDLVLEQLTGRGADVTRQRELWDEIFSAFERGGPDEISQQLKRTWDGKYGRLSDVIGEIEELM